MEPARRQGKRIGRRRALALSQAAGRWPAVRDELLVGRLSVRQAACRLDVAAAAVQIVALRERLEQFLAQILFPACSRSQQRHWGSVYVRGLLLDGEHKSVGAMAKRMPDESACRSV